MTVCEVNGLCKRYPGFSLQDVSFSLESGTVTGFIGRNGAGKTTTIKAMLDLIHTDGGTVRYFGMPYAGNENAIRQRIGFSTGAANYYPKKKLRQLAAVSRSFYENWDEAAYREYLKRFSLDEEKTPSQMSEGMRVKCNLLLALSHRAELLILDEPTSGLDPFSRDELTELFGALRDRGTAVFFSTHITADIEKCADRILYIREGKLVLGDTAQGFRNKLGLPGESLEQTILRAEREARNEETAV